MNFRDKRIKLLNLLTFMFKNEILQKLGVQDITAFEVP